MSEEREAMQAAYAQWIRENLDSGYRPGTRGAWIAALEWQAARQSAEPVYDKSVVARIATQMGWTPPDATTLRVLSSHAIRKHEGVTIFGDPAQVLKVMAAIEGSGAMGQEPVAFRWRRRVRDKWEYETRATLSDADTVRVMLEDGWEAEWLGIVAAPIGDNGSQPAESKRVELTEGQVIEAIQKACGEYRHGCSYSFEDVWNCIEAALLARAQAKEE